MSTQLIQVLTFTDVGAGQQATLPHNINVQGRQLVPDLAMRDSGDFDIVAVTDTEVTVENTSADPATLHLWLQFFHTTQRWFGAKQTENVTPNPFIPAVGAGGAVPDPLTLTGLTVNGGTTTSGLIVRGNPIVGDQNPMGLITAIQFVTDGQLGLVGVYACMGSPEGQVAAPVGSLCMVAGGDGAGGFLYVKEGGGLTVNGWVKH